MLADVVTMICISLSANVRLTNYYIVPARKLLFFIFKIAVSRFYFYVLRVGNVVLTITDIFIVI